MKITDLDDNFSNVKEKEKFVESILNRVKLIYQNSINDNSNKLIESQKEKINELEKENQKLNNILKQSITFKKQLNEKNILLQEKVNNNRTNLLNLLGVNDEDN